MGAIAERRGDLTSLVSNANTTAGAIADESQSLGRTLELAPSTLRKGNTTFVNLRSTLDDLDVLVDASKPATKRLPTLFEQLKFLTAESRPTVRSLRELISIPGPGNDLTNLVARLPRLEQLTSTVFPRTIRTLDRSQNFVNSLRQYTPDLGGAVTKLGQVTNSYDANGHYARVQPMFTPFTENPSTGELTAVPPSQRGAGYQTKRFRRCPGAAMQAPPDGSAPFSVSGCRPPRGPTDAPPADHDRPGAGGARVVVFGRARTATAARATRSARSSTTWPRRCPARTSRWPGPRSA